MANSEVVIPNTVPEAKQSPLIKGEGIDRVKADNFFNVSCLINSFLRTFLVFFQDGLLFQ